MYWKWFVSSGIWDVIYNSVHSFWKEHATEPRRVRKNFMAACAALILRFYGVSNLYK
jgi:hypothetical protein